MLMVRHVSFSVKTHSFAASKCRIWRQGIAEIRPNSDIMSAREEMIVVDRMKKNRAVTAATAAVPTMKPVKVSTEHVIRHVAEK